MKGKYKTEFFGTVILKDWMTDLRDRLRKKPIRGLLGIYWRIRIVWLSLRWVRKVNLGDYVWYNGNKHQVCNGVRSESWRLDNIDNGDSGWVERADCKKVKTFKNFYGSFRSGYGFYMTSWFDIWVNEGIKPWMLGCRIWGKDD